MKNNLKEYMMYIIPAICIGIVPIIYFALYSGKENIAKQMNDVLKETIDIDFHRRNGTEMKVMNDQLSRKVKMVNIIGEQGEETIELPDSVEEYVADQLAAQYILARVNPIKPDDFNAIFNEELEKQGISCPTGIIYRHNDKPQYSGQDSTTYQKAIMTSMTALDIKNTVKVQAWADCDRMMQLRHTDPKVLGFAACYLIAAAFALYYKGKKKEISGNMPTAMQEEGITENIPSIRVDESKQEIYIGDKKCHVTQMEFLIMALLVSQPDYFVTREQIAQTLWPEEKGIADTTLLNNRIDGHINSLRKALLEFPECRLITVKGKGYRLVIPDEE